MKQTDFDKRSKALLDAFLAEVRSTNIASARQGFRESGLIYVRPYRVKAFFRRVPSKAVLRLVGRAERKRQ